MQRRAANISLVGVTAIVVSLLLVIWFVRTIPGRFGPSWVPWAAPRDAGLDAHDATFGLQPYDLPVIERYRPIPVNLSPEPPMKPRSEPRYAARKPLYGTIRLGDAEDNQFLVVIDEPKDGPPKIYIDRKGNGQLRNAGPGNWDRTLRGNCYVNNVTIDVPYSTGRVPTKFNFYRMKGRQPNRLFYYRTTGRKGEAVLDGNRYQMLVLEDNATGCFDDLRSGNLVIDLNQDRKLDGAADSAEFFRLNEPFNVRGKVWEVASLSPDGLRITMRRSPSSVPIKRYLTPGYPAPPFVAKGLSGETIDLKTEAAKSRYILVEFWASWCGPCRAEFPALQRVHARYKNRGLAVVGVSLDSDRTKAVNAAKQAKLTYPHVFDGQGWKNEVALLYRVSGIPQVYLLDRHLTIVAKNLRGPQLEKQLRDLLGPGDDRP